MKKVFALTVVFFVAYLATGQTLYISGGTGGIGSSTNSKIGIGTNEPDEMLSIRSNSFSKVEGTMEFPLTINRVNTNVQSLFLGSDNSHNPIIATNNTGLIFGRYYGGEDSFTEYFRMLYNGNIGIGTSDPLSKLSVNGEVRATEVKVLADISVPDYVFEPEYELRTLQEIKRFIQSNKHLPEIPSAKEIESNGIDLGDMSMRLLKKVEELTLYQIELLEQLESQNKRLRQIELENELMKKELQELKSVEK